MESQAQPGTEQEAMATRAGVGDIPSLSGSEPRDPGGGARRFLSWREWGTFAWQASLVVAIELTDDAVRGLVDPRSPAPALVNAVRVMGFEEAHGLWVEPGMQRFFEQPHHWLGLTIDWSQVVTLVDSIYGISHSLVTLLVAAWIFWMRRRFYPFIRNVFIIATALSVLIYNLFPLAPPRLAVGLRYEGHPFHFVDTVFANGGVNLSFDQYAAMPSLHIAWALIAGGSLLFLARPLLLRIYGALHPIVMTFVVIVTGNHYVMDCLGGLGVDLLGLAGATLILMAQHWSRPPAMRRQQAQQGRALPA
jgi:hypothetical protein